MLLPLEPPPPDASVLMKFTPGFHASSALFSLLLRRPRTRGCLVYAEKVGGSKHHPTTLPTQATSKRAEKVRALHHAQSHVFCYSPLSQNRGGGFFLLHKYRPHEVQHPLLSRASNPSKSPDRHFPLSDARLTGNEPFTMCGSAPELFKYDVQSATCRGSVLRGPPVAAC